MNVRHTALGLVALGAALLTTHEARSAGTRTYTAGRYVMNIGGLDAGEVKSVSGGNVAGDVVATRGAPVPATTKTLSNVQYEQITVTFGSGVGRTMNDWIKETTRRQPARRDGAIIGVDYNGHEKEIREFYQALLTEVASPALDATSKDAATFTVKLAPQTVKEPVADGSKVVTSPPVPAARRAMVANFKIEIPNVDATRVSHIDAIAFKQVVHVDAAGQVQAPETAAAAPQPVSFAVYTSEATAASWIAWSQRGDARPVHVVLVSPDLKSDLVVIDVANAKVSKIVPPPAGEAEAVRRVQVQLVAPSVQFDFKPAP